MLVSERLWIMALDDRGLPRLQRLSVCVTAGLLLDLERARLIRWDDDGVVRTGSPAPTGLLGWGAARLAHLDAPLESRFALSELHQGSWDRVGESLVEQGVATAQRRRFRRGRRFALTDAGLRRRVVTEVRTKAFDAAAEGDEDPCLAVIAAAGVADEMLSLTPFLDDDVAAAVADRASGPVEAKVEAATLQALVAYWLDSGSPVPLPHS